MEIKKEVRDTIIFYKNGIVVDVATVWEMAVNYAQKYQIDYDEVRLTSPQKEVL